MTTDAQGNSKTTHFPINLVGNDLSYLGNIRNNHKYPGEGKNYDQRYTGEVTNDPRCPVEVSYDPRHPWNFSNDHRYTGEVTNDYRCPVKVSYDPRHPWNFRNDHIYPGGGQKRQLYPKDVRNDHVYTVFLKEFFETVNFEKCQQTTTKA